MPGQKSYSRQDFYGDIQRLNQGMHSRSTANTFTNYEHRMVSQIKKGLVSSSNISRPLNSGQLGIESITSF